MHSLKDILLRISGISILLAALLYLFLPAVAPWVLAFAVALFSVVTVTTPYPGKSLRGKRLFNFQVFSCLFMIVATYLMFRHRNEWVLIMAIGAVFQLYASIVIPKALEKEKSKESE